MKNSPNSEDFFSLLYKMTTRSQKRKTIAELVSGEFEASVAENNSSENLIAGPSKTLRIEPENLNEIKTSLRKEILSDLSKILAENHKEILKLIAQLSKKRAIRLKITTLILKKDVNTCKNNNFD